MNLSKTNYIVFGSLKKDWNFSITVNNTIIDKVNSTKFLGVVIDSNLTWADHINLIALKISKSVGILSKLKHSLPRKILRTLYQTLILPHLSYCCSVWSSATKTQLNKLFILQKRAIRHITGINYCAHTSKHFLALNLLKLSDLINMNLASFIYRVTHNCVPSSLTNVFKTNNQIHIHYTRQSSNIHCPPCRTSLIRHNTFNRAIDFWNSLSTNTQGCNSLVKLRKYIKQICIRKY